MIKVAIPDGKVQCPQFSEDLSYIEVSNVQSHQPEKDKIFQQHFQIRTELA